MKHKFLFSVFVIFFILVFIALGSWQIIRLNWKNNLISEIENSKESKKIPKGEISGLCKFCKYQTQCFEEGNGLTEKPLSIPKSNESQTQGERK